MTTTTAKLASAKLNDGLGITDETARKLYDNLGTHVVGIVELKADWHKENADDEHEVTLCVTRLELAPDQATEDHVRELQRALYRGRTPTQADIDTLDDVEPGAGDIIREGANTLTLLQDDDETPSSP